MSNRLNLGAAHLSAMARLADLLVCNVDGVQTVFNIDDNVNFVQELMKMMTMTMVMLKMTMLNSRILLPAHHDLGCFCFANFGMLWWVLAAMLVTKPHIVSKTCCWRDTGIQQTNELFSRAVGFVSF